MNQQFPDQWEFLYPKEVYSSIHLLQEDNVQVWFGSEYNRTPSSFVDHLVSEYRHRLVDIIDFNRPSSKFRLAKTEASEEGLRLCIGLTDYIEYLCTNHDLKINQRLRSLGVLDCNDPDCYLSHAIGNLAIVETNDAKIALLLRNDTVATFRNYYDAPGGHPEPHRIKNLISMSTHCCQNAIRDELFDSIKQEVIEELNVSQAEIRATHLIGVLRTYEDGGKPEMIFYMPIDLNGRELQARYDAPENAEVSAESKKLLLIEPWQKSSGNNLKFTVPTRAALTIYRKLLDQGVTEGRMA